MQEIDSLEVFFKELAFSIYFLKKIKHITSQNRIHMYHMLYIYNTEGYH